MEIDFNKMDGLVPAIIQDAQTDKVLMLGFMNVEAYQSLRISYGRLCRFTPQSRVQEPPLLLSEPFC